MDDEKQNKEEGSTQQEREGNNVPIEENLSIVEEARRVRDEIKEENDRREKILKEEQTLAATKMLGGTSGAHIEEPIKEVTPKDYMKKVLGGEMNG